ENQSEMILEMMDSELPPLRLWSLDKISKYPTVAEDFRERIFSLLSDDSRDVRLQTAKGLVNMSDLNPAEVLLEHFQSETDHEVALAMFEALGEACFFAFSPGSPVDLSQDIKTQTLGIATDYLRSDSAESVVKGAKVIRKILELNNLSNEMTKSYLEALRDRYEKSMTEDDVLRADLLSVLAHLCGQSGTKADACVLYEPYLKEGLTVQDNPALRLAAAQGLSYVDKVKALELFKQNDLMSDENPAVQQVVIDLAGQTGDTSDLQWLLGAMAANGYSDHAWLAIKNICQRQEAKFLVKWVAELEAADGATGEYVREILDIAEQKAASEKNETLQVQIQQQILSRLVERKTWESALTYLDEIGYDPAEKRFSAETDASVLKVFLYSDAANEVISMLQTEMGRADLPDTSLLVPVLKEYFLDETVSDEPKLLLLNKIRSSAFGDHPNWSALLRFIDDALMAQQPGPVPPPSVD
ncbi:MAG: HEAT repeat domain-containing protein, partial [Planctomycetota bacterium]